MSLKQKPSDKNKKREKLQQRKTLILKVSASVFAGLCVVGIVSFFVNKSQENNIQKLKDATAITSKDYGSDSQSGRDILDATSALNEKEIKGYVSGSVMPQAITDTDKDSWISSNYDKLKSECKEFGTDIDKAELTDAFGNSILNIYLKSEVSADTVSKLSGKLNSNFKPPKLLGVFVYTGSHAYWGDKNNPSVDVTVSGNIQSTDMQQKLTSEFGSGVSDLACYSKDGIYIVTGNLNTSLSSNDLFNAYVTFVRNLATVSSDSDTRFFCNFSKGGATMLILPETSRSLLNKLPGLSQSGKSILQVQFISEMGKTTYADFEKYMGAYRRLKEE